MHDHIPWSNDPPMYEVIDGYGDVVEDFESKTAALAFAKSNTDMLRVRECQTRIREIWNAMDDLDWSV